MNLQDLPNDILEKIYHLKHLAEYKDVLDDIVNIKKCEVQECIALVKWLEDSRIFKDEPNNEIEIWVALKNEGIITTNELINVIDDIYFNSDLTDFDLNQIDDSYFYINYSNITMKQVLNNNKDFISEAIRHMSNNELSLKE